MIKTEIIDSINDAMALIADLGYNNDIKRVRSTYCYRGMPDSSYALATSLSRNCKHLQKKLEGGILRNFTKYACKEDPSLSDNVWRQMIVGQHHSLPTRLLDWTHSPIIAMHFATTEDDPGDLSKRDCVIWRIDLPDLNRNLPDKYKAALEKDESSIFTVDALTALVNDPDQYDRDMGADAFVCIEPPSVDQRIINQYSFFSIMPLDMTDIEGFLDTHTENTVRYIIRKELRWDVRDTLDQLNVSERIIYPDLDGLSKWVGRHYYVKD